MKLVALTSDRVYADWSWLRNGIQHVIEKSRPHYRAEDVYTRLTGNTAWAYALVEGEDEIGFAIFTREFDPDGLVLYVWILWCEPGSALARRLDIFGALEVLARELKAKRIRMQSPRNGWERFFTPVAAVYEHEVTT